MWCVFFLCCFSLVYWLSLIILFFCVNCSVDLILISFVGSISGDGDGGSKKYVDIRIYWGDLVEGWIGIDCDDEMLF